MGVTIFLGSEKKCLLREFCRYKFAENMRFRGATQGKLEYAKLLLKVGSGGRDNQSEAEDYDTYYLMGSKGFRSLKSLILLLIWSMLPRFVFSQQPMRKLINGIN